MQKTVILLLIGLAGGSTARAQSIFDLLTQLSLDTQKLTALKGTLQDMYTGYASIEKGYTRIRDVARDNFNLHAAFLDGLLVLSPNVRNDPHVSDILSREYRIVSAYKTATTGLNGNGLFTVQEMNYIIDTYSALLQQTLQSAEELTMILTDNQLRMSDAQRLSVIDRIDKETRGQLGTLQQLSNMLAVQAAQRQAASNDINTLKLLYGIPH